MQIYHWVGLLAVLTVAVIGILIGRVIGLSAAEGAYLTALTLAGIGWLLGRRMARR